MNNVLADFVANRREELGLTQQALADIAGLKRDNIAQVESGKSKLPVPETRRKLAAALRVSHEAILVAAGELLPEEASQLATGQVFPPGTPQSAVMALLDQMTDREAAALAETGRIMLNLKRGDDFVEWPPVSTVEHNDLP